MKKWVLRIGSALLGLAAGLGAAAIGEFRFAPKASVKRANVVTATQVKPLRAPSVNDTQTTTEIDEIMQPHAVPISPYEIKRLIDENNSTAREQQGDGLSLEPILNQLGLIESEYSMFKGYKCRRNCEARIVKLELDGKPGKEVMLGIGIDSEYLYLIFRHSAELSYSGKTWTLLGYITAYLRWSDPRYRLVTVGNHRWLAIGYVTGHGSGYGSSAESWYDISDDGVRQVFSYQTGVYWGMANPTIDSDTRVLRVEHRDGVATVILQSSTSYGFYERFDDKYQRLWTTKRQATYFKGPGMEEFAFDPFRSGLSEEDLNSSEDGIVTAKEFLKYNYLELTRLAARGNTKQKEWLRKYLDTCNDSIEKQSLQTAIGGK